MSALTAPVEEGVRGYLWTPVNFGEDTERQRIAEADAFRAGSEWTLAHTDWRVLGGLIPGWVEARHVRLGDAVRLTGGLSEVVAVRHNGTPGYVYLTGRTESGETLYRFRASVPLDVRAVKRVEP